MAVAVGKRWEPNECRRHGTFPDFVTNTFPSTRESKWALLCGMPHAYSQNLIHLVFSTKDRRDLIAMELQPRLWKYLAGIALNHSMYPKAIGGIANHVHILVDLPPTKGLAEAAQVLKANSSRWMREHDRAFAWQRGYGGFGVSESNRVAVERYIARQEEHHRKISFEQEFEELLKRHNIQYDPRWMFG
jgi:putative transposase